MTKVRNSLPQNQKQSQKHETLLIPNFFQPLSIQ